MPVLVGKARPVSVTGRANTVVWSSSVLTARRRRSSCRTPPTNRRSCSRRRQWGRSSASWQLSSSERSSPSSTSEWVSGLTPSNKDGGYISLTDNRRGPWLSLCRRSSIGRVGWRHSRWLSVRLRSLAGQLLQGGPLPFQDQLVARFVRLVRYQALHSLFIKTLTNPLIY